MTIEEHYDKRSSSYDSTFDMLYFKGFDDVGEHSSCVPYINP